jgi:hypothetical protein
MAIGVSAIGEIVMAHKTGCAVTLRLLLGIAVATSALAADRAKIAVLNPRGIQPAIRRIPMAPRLDSLDGKTIYIVDTRYPLTEQFVQEVYNVLKERYPKTTWVLKKKRGTYFDDDPKLWQEIKEEGQGMIMAIGH